MVIKGLNASPEGIKKAERALIRNSLNKKALALELGIARSTVSLFFKSKRVSRLNFEEICKKLGLDARDIIANPLTETETEEKEQSNPHFQDAQPEQIEEVLDNFCDEVVVERVRSHSPICAEDFDELGRNKAKERDFDGALENFNRAIKLNPDYANAYNNRANVRHELGDEAGAIEDYTKAILLNPKCSDFHKNRGIIYGKLDDIEEALKDFTQAIELNPDDAFAWTHRGDVYLLELDYLQGALKDYTQAARLNPNNAITFYNLGVIRFRLGNKEKALEDYTQAIHLQRDLAQAYQNRGIVHYELGDSQRTLEDFQNAKNLYCVHGKKENYYKVLNLIEELRQREKPGC